MTYTRDENLQFFEDGSSKIGVVRFLVPQNVSFLRSLATKMTLSFKICQKRGLFELKLSKDDAGFIFVFFSSHIPRRVGTCHVTATELLYGVFDENFVCFWSFFEKNYSEVTKKRK